MREIPAQFASFREPALAWHREYTSLCDIGVNEHLNLAKEVSHRGWPTVSGRCRDDPPMDSGLGSPRSFAIDLFCALRSLLSL